MFSKDDGYGFYVELDLEQSNDYPIFNKQKIKGPILPTIFEEPLAKYKQEKGNYYFSQNHPIIDMCLKVLDFYVCLYSHYRRKWFN